MPLFYLCCLPVSFENKSTTIHATQFIIHTKERSVLYLCTKFQADSSIHSKVVRGPKISKLGHMTISHAPFERDTLNLCKSSSTHTYCQILCFYLNPLLSNGWKQCEWTILMAKLAMRMRRVTWPGGRGHPKPHIWNQRPQFAFYGATTTIKGSLHGSTPIVKRF